MKRKLFLHIGSHRTATTSIQRFLNANFTPLNAQGVLFPYKEPRHVRLMNQIFAGETSSAQVAEDLNSRADSKSIPIHSIILSDEDISTRPDPGILAEFRAHFDVKIVFSLRRQDTWLESWYFQNIKWQWNAHLSHCDFDTFLTQRDDFHWINYDRYIALLEALFGTENILLTIFEKAQMPEGPVIDFCRLVGLDTAQGFTDPQHMNASMSAEMVEFIRHLPLDQFNVPARDLVRQALEAVDRKSLGHKGRQSERLMPLDLRQSIMAEYAPGNKAIANRYFNRDTLFLEPLPKAGAPLAEMRIPEGSAHLMERFVAPLLMELVQSGMLRGEG